MSDAIAQFEVNHVDLVSRVRSSLRSDKETAAWRQRSSNPDALIARWLKGVTIPDDSALALSGVGDGSHILALLELMPENGLVFCAEPDVARFKSFLSTSTATKLLADERVCFGVGVQDEAFFRSMVGYSVVDFEHAEPLIFAPLFSEDPKFYAAFFREFAQRIEMLRKLYGTNLTKSGLWQGNTFRNFKSLIRTPDPAEFHGLFHGIPMIMAGAGPSLDESIDFLRWAQNRAVIVAGNSSMRALVNGGVRPHFVLAADPNETTDRGFEGVELGDTILVCPFLVHPGVVPRFGDRVITWSLNNAVATHFRKVIGRERCAHVTEQGTVSACAFDLAVIFGSSALFFVGQDLAARVDGRMHASDSFYEDSGTDQTAMDKCRWMPGNTIEKVPVEEKLFVYLKTFAELSKLYSKELKLRDGKGLPIYNLSRLGARIDGMPYLDFEKAESVLKSFGGGSSEFGWKRTQSVLAGYQVGWGRIGKELRAFREYVEGICSFALEKALAAELGNLELDVAVTAKADLEAKISAQRDFETILNDGQLKMELYVHRRAKAYRSRRGSSGSVESELKVLVGYFWAIAEGSYQVLADLDASAETKK